MRKKTKCVKLITTILKIVLTIFENILNLKRMTKRDLWKFSTHTPAGLNLTYTGGWSLCKQFCFTLPYLDRLRILISIKGVKMTLRIITKKYEIETAKQFLMKSIFWLMVFKETTRQRRSFKNDFSWVVVNFR